jgi:thiol peroxidase
MLLGALTISTHGDWSITKEGKMTKERTGVATFLGKPITLVGEEVKVGQKAPDFTVTDAGLQTYNFSSQAKGRVRIISSVPSLDTPVCDAQPRRFHQEAVLFADVEILTISMDLPFAQKRFCQTAGIDRVKTLSDHKEASFGLAYGLLIKELRLDSRAVFIIDKDDTVRYVEYVKEVSNSPDYDAALKALGALIP